MLKIKFDPNGISNVLADGSVEKFCHHWVEMALAHPIDVHVNISQELVWLGFRIMVKRGLIKSSDIEFVTVLADGQELVVFIDKNGRMPNDLSTSHQENFLTEMLRRRN